MTQEAIKRQLEAIKAVGDQLSKDPVARRLFLIKVGVIKEEAPKQKRQAKKRTN